MTDQNSKSPVDIVKFRYYVDKVMQRAHLDTTHILHLVLDRYEEETNTQYMQGCLVTRSGERDFFLGIDVNQYEQDGKLYGYYEKFVLDLFAHLTEENNDETQQTTN